MQTRAAQLQTEALASDAPSADPDNDEGVRTVVSGERSRMRALRRSERSRTTRSSTAPPPPSHPPPGSVAMLVLSTVPSVNSSPSDSARTASSTSSCHSVLMLTLAHEHQRIVVGGVILELPGSRVPQLEPQLLHGIAKALHEHQSASSSVH